MKGTSHAAFAAALVGVAAIGASPVLAQTTGTPNGKPQTLTPHKPHSRAPTSLLAPVHIAPDAKRGLTRAYTGTPIDVTQYHYDGNRTGWNPNETDLTPAAIQSGKFGLLATLAVDGNVFGQPLLVSGLTLPDSSVHDVLIVATGNNSVYAFDAKTYAQLWKVNLGQQQSTDDVGCHDVEKGYGISATPVIVRSGNTATIYLTAAIEPNRYEFHTMLHAIDAGSGADVRPPVEINPSAKLSDRSVLKFDPQNQWNRAGIAYGNGSLYIGIGSHCDNNAYGISGWLLKYGTDLTSQASFHTIQTPHGYELASIWMTGFAPAIDASGNVFVVTGNGDFTHPGFDWGQSVLKLNSALRVQSSFTPSGYADLNNGDTDFGSGGVMLVPHSAGQKGPDTAVAIGKSGILYLLNQRSLGGLTTGDTRALQKIPLDHGVWGGPAYYSGSTGPTVFEQGDGGALFSFGVTSTAQPVFLTKANGNSVGGYGGSLPIVSSNGAAPGTGVVWVVRRSAPIELEAYDAEALGNPIYSANIGKWSNVGNNNPFLTAMEANGRVYVASYLTVNVFGLTQ